MIRRYANNQHELGADIATDPRQTSFYKAMARCTGVLLILDPDGTPFTRAWCCFEEAMVVRDAARTGAPLLLDVATVDSKGQAHATTQGPTAADQKRYDALSDYRKSQTSVNRIKMEREKSFPRAVLERGFRVDTFNSAASVAIDRTRIFNAICGVPPDQLDAVVPRAEDPAFLDVDAALSGLFAEAALWLAAQAGELAGTVEVLRRDTARRHVRLHIPGATEPSLAALAPAFRAWPALTEVDLLASNSALTELAGLEALADCPQLAVVHGDFASCAQLADVAALGAGLGQLQALTALHLSFEECSQLHDSLRRSFDIDSRADFLAALGA